MKYIFFFLCLLTATITLHAQPTRNLIAHYEFEDTTRGVLYDNSGNGSNGIIIGKPSFGCGIKGNSFRLDGVNDFIILFGNVNETFSTADFTISLYFKANDIGQAQALIAKADSCAANRFLQIRVQALQRYVEAFLRETPVKQASITGRYNKDCWHHLVLARSQSNLTIYLDGKEASNIPTAIGSMNLRSNAPFTIGDSPCRGNNLVRFKGEIDELYVYSRRLSVNEIKELYTPVDKILTRDTVVYVGGSFRAQTTKTCATQFAWSPTTGISDPTSATPIITPEVSTTYALQFINSAGSSSCRTTDSLYIKVVDPSKLGCSQILLPNAFTPNDDKRNDTYYINNPYVIERLVKFEIYSRWGERVFATDDKFAQWDGKVNGIIAATDTYVWLIEYECSGRRDVEKGTLTLIR